MLSSCCTAAGDSCTCPMVNVGCEGNIVDGVAAVCAGGSWCWPEGPDTAESWHGTAAGAGAAAGCTALAGTAVLVRTGDVLTTVTTRRAG